MCGTGSARSDNVAGRRSHCGAGKYVIKLIEAVDLAGLIDADIAAAASPACAFPFTVDEAKWPPGASCATAFTSTRTP